MNRTVTLAVLLAALGARATYGQPTPPADDSRQAEAKAYFERGSAHYKAGRYLEARAEFAAGYELSHRPLFLFNMAECSRLDGNLDLAREGYERYLREAPNGSEASLARQRLAALGQKPAAPAPTTQPAPAPAPAPAPPPVKVAPAPPPAPAPAPAPAKVAPMTRPAPAQVAHPALQPAVPPPATEIAPDQPAPALQTSTPPPSESGGSWPTKKIAALGVASAGVAFLATGIFYWRRSVSLGDDVTSACAHGCDWNVVKGNYDDSHSAAHAQWAFLGLGVVGLAAGGALYYLNQQEQHRPLFGVAPTNNGATVTWSGSW